jgi:hypothetical protein
MRNEVRLIPTAPRRVRPLPLLAHRWPLLAIGGTLTLVGGLCAWMLLLARGAFASDQRRLDAGPVAQTTAQITRIDEPLRDGGQAVRWPDGIQRQCVHYTFTWRDVECRGQSFVRLGSHRPGDMVTIELLPEEPNRNRTLGGLLYLERSWLQPENWLGTLVVPGGLLLLGWLAGVFQLRKVLVHGDVSLARVTAIEPVRGLIPEMLRVQFEFRDHRAVLRPGRHWVRVHSELGARLLRGRETGVTVQLPVLHDRMFPQWSRLVLVQHFLPASPEPVDPGVRLS